MKAAINIQAFSLSDIEGKRCSDFRKAHSKCDQAFRYSFTPTGIASHVSIQCRGCKRKKDVSDYESW